MAWKTETRHPLSDRLIHQGAYLYGVRFGTETCYCLLDIDVKSAYHPRQDPLAISRLVAALERLGLVSYLACTSSYSGGLHLYFPFQIAQSSWQLAIGLACLLENAGFRLQPGQLEVFPNPRPYHPDGTISLFNAHRLPLQIGSYLLNDELQPIWSDPQTFVRRWCFAEERNDVNSTLLKQILKQAKRRHLGISGKAEKFINDLNAEIEVGWTGCGQTNRLLGRITMRAYIFQPLLSGGEPLEGQALVDEVVRTARSLPGYREWCRHQHEIEHRAAEWVRCIENSHYFHYGDRSHKLKPEVINPELNLAVEQLPSWNQRQSASARERIRCAIADLLEHDRLPARATARFQALLSYGIGGGSLYRHRDLWHPNYLNLPTEQIPSPVENPPYPPNVTEESQLDCAEDASNCQNSPSLFPGNGGNVLISQVFSDCSLLSLDQAGGNSDDRDSVIQPDDSDEPQGIQAMRRVFAEIQARQAAVQSAAQMARSQQQRCQTEAAVQRQIARMQQFLASNDPILIAEALAWAQVNPGILNICPSERSPLAQATAG